MASRFFMLHSIIFCWDAPHPSCFRAEGRTYRFFGRRSSLKSAFPKHCAICRIQYSIFFGKMQGFCVGFSQIYPYNDKCSDCGRKKGASEEAPRFFCLPLPVPPDSRSRAAGDVQNAVQKAVLAVLMYPSPGIIRSQSGRRHSGPRSRGIPCRAIPFQRRRCRVPRHTAPDRGGGAVPSGCASRSPRLR